MSDQDPLTKDTAMYIMKIMASIRHPEELMIRALADYYTQRKRQVEEESEDETVSALQAIRAKLDTLRSITNATILIPGGPQEHYHELIEEAYAALGTVETEIDELRAELEYQHQRLDEIRDAALAEHEDEEGTEHP